MNRKSNIAIIGLGYVGLPLAIEFSKKGTVHGFDINKNRVHDLKNGIDTTLEIDDPSLLTNSNMKYTTDINDISHCDIYIVTVPTPIDSAYNPDLIPLISASKMLGQVLSKDNIVIYESTVYPGATEEICVPVLEENSGLKFNKEFFVGYSPERINPGDKKHTVSNITKVTSGSNEDVANKIDALYKEIISAGTFMASSIKVAEAAKVIENTQRDVNIALINELSKIFNLMNVDTLDVLEAASTKWNFLNFKPGLVGGHCIGVDPYYLTYKAKQIGYNPEMILAGRRLNDGMGKYIADNTLKGMIKKDILINNSKLLILGFTFKENCPDIRNTRVIDIYNELSTFGIEVDIYDPWASARECAEEYKINLIKKIENQYDAIIFAVAHDEFKQFNKTYLNTIRKSKSFIYDLKGVVGKHYSDKRL